MPTKMSGVPFGTDPWYWGFQRATALANQPWNYFQSILSYVITLTQRHGQTDDLPTQTTQLYKT